MERDDVVLLHVAHGQHQREEINFRELRAMVSIVMEIGRPLKSEEVKSVLAWVDEEFARIPVEEIEIELSDAAAALRARGIDRAQEILPHLCLYEPRADDFSIAAGLGMTAGIVDRALYLDNLRDTEQLLAGLGVSVKRITCGVEEMQKQIEQLQGNPRSAEDVSMAAEAIAFPRKVADIRKARKLRGPEPK